MALPLPPLMRAPDDVLSTSTHPSTSMNSSTNPSAAQLTDVNGLATGTYPPPLPPASPLPPTIDAAITTNEPVDSQERSRSRSHSSHRSSSEGEASGDEEQGEPQLRWRPIEEDKSEPGADELVWIESKEEPSAADHAYWENRAFFDLADPELTPLDQGRIDWEIQSFNGTEEKPNKDEIMRSPTVRVGKHNWRIKFFPRGNNCEFLSVYLECVDMQTTHFEDSEDFEAPPFPFLADTDHAAIKKRRSAAVQLAVVMYNPAEPRVFEYRTDAHQYSRVSSDYGFKYFSQDMIREFHCRKHGQRQAMLRGDKLAFSAYIRVVDDPTGCMWQHDVHDRYANSIATTGLRPFAGQEAHFAAIIPLLHFDVFRNCLRFALDQSVMVHGLMFFLLKMFTRKRSRSYGLSLDREQADVIDWLRRTSKDLCHRIGEEKGTAILGNLDPDDGAAVAGNRLKTKDCSSVQEAVSRHPTRLAYPKLLTLELERQQFDRDKRRWMKVTNRVSMEDCIMVSGVKYWLWAFITHCGDLQSNRHNSYVRPGGPRNLWYAYQDGQVTAMTHKQAVGEHCGFDEIDAAKKANKANKIGLPFSRNDSFNNEEETAYIVMYVRDDTRHGVFMLPDEEAWNVPEKIREGKLLPDTARPISPAGEKPVLAFHEEQQVHKQSLATIAEGAATPECFSTDGEDVVMSDCGDDSSETDAMATSTAEMLAKVAELEPDVPTWFETVDTLGKDCYRGNMSVLGYHGEGHLIAMSGNEYQGNFRNGLQSGYGRMIYGATGNIYEGAWLDGEHHGLGKLTELATGNVFEGGWKEGKKHGDFVLKGKVTEEDKGCCSICYDKELSTVFYDCGHVVACKDCAERIDNCPVCRKRVLHRMQIYGVKITLE